MSTNSRLLGLLLASSCAVPAWAQDLSLADLEQKLVVQQAQIEQLRLLVAEQSAQLTQLTKVPPPVSDAAPATAAGAVSSSAPVVASARIQGLDVGGDLRVRQEWNGRDGRDRSRSTLRARLRATYAATPDVTIGAQLSTGDQDDPNSTDVTLSSFVDDFNVSLDQVWVRYTNGGFSAYAGKFSQIFQRTDMVWDGDVAPQGLGARYSLDLGGGAAIDARGVYFVIDEASTARDSDMLGGQLVATTPLSQDLKLSLSGAYYHYRLGSINGADAGDFRSNLVAGGRYLSDFHLADGIASLAWSGPDERWPVVLTTDVVHNFGAAVSADTGFNVELAAGRTAKRGDLRIAYNYSQVQVDAVFAAFSHDNIDLATNYRLHGLGISYVPANNLLVDLAYYHYRPLDRLYSGALNPSDWIDRLRLNVMVSF